MPNEKKWTSICSELRKVLILNSSPIGIKMLREARDLLMFQGIKIMTRTAPCHMAAIARYYGENGVIGASSEGIRCVLGAACIGLIKAPDRVSSGILNIPFVRDALAAENLQKSIKMLGLDSRKYSALMMAPLDIISTDPDVIVIYGTPAQMLRLIIGSAYLNGEAILANMTGQGTLCSSIAKVLTGQKIVIDIPCIGDRTYGLVKDEEMVAAISSSFVSDLIEGLRMTEKSASLPFKPFLSWPVVLTPDFDIRSNELG